MSRKNDLAIHLCCNPFALFCVIIFLGDYMMILYYCMTLNSVVNPWIYMMFNYNLVESLRHLLCPCIGKQFKSSYNHAWVLLLFVPCPSLCHVLHCILFYLVLGCSGDSRICSCMKGRQDFDNRKRSQAYRPGWPDNFGYNVF